MGLYLGIDTSNYTTSASVCDGREIIKNEKIVLDVKEGERGLRQSDAVFAHIKNLPEVLSAVGESKFDAIGCSSRPRNVEGSYMPCFKVGESFADSLGALLKVPVYKFSHQEGHISAAAYSSGFSLSEGKVFNAFHVSGGTTEILLCREEKGKIKIEKIGGTLDLNAGQAIDRAGVLLGFKFPCGADLEKEALTGNLPEEPKICVNGLDCNLSGLENKVVGMVKDGLPRGDVALYVLKFVEKTLDRLTENLKSVYSAPVLYAGGVMSNCLIKKTLSKYQDVYFADRAFSSDNAAGIALLAMKAHVSANGGEQI